MQKVTSKRQITLPVELCAMAQIAAGDNIECFVDRLGVISIMKKSTGAAKGILRNVKTEQNISDEASLNSAIDS